MLKSDSISAEVGTAVLSKVPRNTMSFLPLAALLGGIMPRKSRKGVSEVDILDECSLSYVWTFSGGGARCGKRALILLVCDFSMAAQCSAASGVWLERGNGRPRGSRRAGGKIEGCEVVHPVQKTKASLGRTVLSDSVISVDELLVMEARWTCISEPSATICMNFSS